MVENFFYYSSSMIPTFTPGDVLKVCLHKGRAVTAGDIVVFFSTEKQKNITHRVVAIKNGGIITCGDNPSSHRDPWVLSRKDILGSVNGYERSGRYYSVLSGKSGLIYFYYLRLIAFFIRGPRILLRPIYRFVAGRINLEPLLPDAYRPNILSLKRGKKGKKYIMVMGNKVIGRKRFATDNWQIKFPYRFFVRNI